jgi:hypothetical protein
MTHKSTNSSSNIAMKKRVSNKQITNADKRVYRDKLVSDLSKKGINFNKEILKNFKSRNLQRKHISEFGIKPKRFKKISNQLDIDQANEAYYGIDAASKPPISNSIVKHNSSFTSKPHLKRGNSYNFEPISRPKATSSGTFTNLAFSFSHSNRLNKR